METFAVYVLLIMAVPIVILTVMIIQVRHRILLSRLEGNNISEKNLFYKIVTKLFISNLPE